MERQGDSPHDHAFVELPVPSMLSAWGEADLQVLIRETEEKLKLNACRSVARAVTCLLRSLCSLKRKLELSLSVQRPEGLALLLSPRGPCVTRYAGSSCLVQFIHICTCSLEHRVPVLEQLFRKKKERKKEEEEGEKKLFTLSTQISN